MNPNQWFGFISIENLVSDWFGYIRIDVSELIGLSRIDFWQFFISNKMQNVFRIGLELFGLSWFEFLSESFLRVRSN